MSTKELKVSFNAPLNELDTEVQTYGCRANNPDILLIIPLQIFVLLHLKMVFVESRLVHGKNNIIN